MSKRNKKKHEEEHPDETWLVPYSDVLTLLLALFIVLFASSTIDAKKFEQMMQTFAIEFNGGGMSGILDGGVKPIEQGGKSEKQIKTEDTAKPDAAKSDDAKSDAAKSDTAKSDSNNQGNIRLNSIKKVIDTNIANNNMKGAIGTHITEEGVVIEILTTALFETGSAQLTPTAKEIAEFVSKQIEPYSQNILIAGHTDNEAVASSSRFSSNWDLSAKRAINFMEYMFEINPKLNPMNFGIAGYAQYKPLLPNITTYNKRENRRIEVTILKDR